MRAFGFTLMIIGGIVIWLGWQGKVTKAFSALVTGQVPNATSAQTNAAAIGDTTGMGYTSSITGTASGNFNPAYPGGPLIAGH